MAWRASPGNVSLSVSVNEVDFSSKALTFEFVAQPSILLVRPEFGAKGGNTELSITGDNIPERNGLLCSFSLAKRGRVGDSQSAFSTAATRINATHVTCSSPSRAQVLHASGVNSPMRNELGMQVDVRIIFGDNSIFSNAKPIHILDDFDLTYIEPSIGLANGHTLVRVSGYGLRDTNNLKCRVAGTLLVMAHFVSDRLLVCEIPTREKTGGASLISIELTLNGRDFSSNSATFRYHDGQSFIFAEFWFCCILITCLFALQIAFRPCCCFCITFNCFFR